MSNIRQLTDWLGVEAVKKLRSAHAFATVIGLPLNSFVTVAPFRGNAEAALVPSPADAFAAFRNWLGVWVRRRAKVPFTFVGVVHSKPDGSDAHLHALVHLPRKLIPDLEAALDNRYPDIGAIHIRTDDGRTYRHDSGYHGSTLNYMLGHMSPQAWWSLGKTVRRRRDRAPFVGKRCFITANIAERAQGASLQGKTLRFPRPSQTLQKGVDRAGLSVTLLHRKYHQTTGATIFRKQLLYICFMATVDK